MQKVYYNLMPNRALALPAVLLFIAVTALKAQQPSSNPAPIPHDTHDNITVSAEPWTNPSQYKQRFSKKSPMTGGVLAIHVSFKNESAQTVKVSLNAIRLTIDLGDSGRQELRSLSADEVADAVTKPGSKAPNSPRIPLPIPTTTKANHDKNWNEVQKAAQSAALPGPIVPPHDTLQGLVYFDLRGQFDLVESARLYVPELSVLENNRSILFFDIPLNGASSP